MRRAKMLTRQELIDYMHEIDQIVAKVFVGLEHELFSMAAILGLMGKMLAVLDVKYTEKNKDERD
jgi:hypothetical protein